MEINTGLIAIIGFIGVGLGLIGIIYKIVLNSRTVFEYNFHVLHKKDKEHDKNFLHLCEYKGHDGWMLSQIDHSDSTKTLLIFTRTKTNIKFF